jgi:hypothetical protein
MVLVSQDENISPGTGTIRAATRMYEVSVHNTRELEIDPTAQHGSVASDIDMYPEKQKM